MLRFSILILLFSLSAWCQPRLDTLVHYYISGINGGPPTHTLTIYTDGSMVLVIDSFNVADTIPGNLDAREMVDLIALFTDNGFSRLDSTYFGGCLSCPEFSVTYEGKRVYGSLPIANQNLAAILRELDAIILAMQLPTSVVFREPGARPVRWVRGALLADGSSFQLLDILGRSLAPRDHVNMRGLYLQRCQDSP